MPGRHAIAIILLQLAAVGLGAASPKIALVRVGEIYRALPTTQALESGVEAERAAILHDARADAYRSVLTELDQLRKGIARIPKDDRATLNQAHRNFALKHQEALTLQREFQTFRERKTDEINTRLVAEMEKILSEIHAKARQIGSERGFDWVIDGEGRTNTGLPFVLYAKAPTDITDAVLDALGGPAVSTESSD